MIGKWRNERGDTIEFFQDGTASFFYNEKIFASNVSGKWSDLDDDTIKVTANMGFLGEKTITADWTVSGETLVWKESGGTAREYHKVQAGGRRVRFQ